MRSPGPKASPKSASVGGFVKQYNVILDPQRMRDLGITLEKSPRRDPGQQFGCRRPHRSSSPEFEYIVRGKGYLRDINDLGNIVLKTNNGTPVLLRDVARVELGPDERRGITELNGEGEVASGIALQRFGAQRARRHRKHEETLRGDRQQPAEIRRDRAGL